MMRDELLSSYKDGAMDALKEKLRVFPSEGKQEMVTLSSIPFVSLCAHHMVPFFGEAHVGYIPQQSIIGLSKIPRVVDFFSHKLQVQERMTSEVADFLQEYLDPLAVIVYIEARHLCMEARGVRKVGVVTRTSALRGKAHLEGVKQEFYTLISTRGRVA